MIDFSLMIDAKFVAFETSASQNRLSHRPTSDGAGAVENNR
jgi:hypothetical protein